MPLTDSDSSTRELMSATRPCRAAVIFRRSPPTRRVIHTKNGRTASENAASRQSSANIATIVASTVVTFETIDVAVLVTTLWIPPMSLAIRDWTSPVRVRVKNASDIRCRCR
jgi:RNA:NAD 2'-phosphotransferase (TPT1/KptA family)